MNAPASWREINLSGVRDRALLGARGARIPMMLRHYHPVTESAPYESLTVLGEQLYVYRRAEGERRWVLVAVLPIIDLDMRREAQSGRALVLTSKAVYVSQDLESWDRLEGLGARGGR